MFDRSLKPSARATAMSIALGIHAAMGVTIGATVLVTESFPLQSGPGFGAAYLDEVASTPAGLGAWGQKGAVGLQGNQSIYPSGASYVNQPPTIVAMKFNIGSIVSGLNVTYGAGHWSIASPQLTMQYSYYANNAAFAGGAGSFKTYLVQNNSWRFSNVGAGSVGAFNGYQAGTDPIYATDAASLAVWSGGQADVGSTTYPWLSPPGVTVGPSTVNPSYSGWTTDKSGSNQGLLVSNLITDPLLVNDITGSTLANPNVSFYLMPNDNTLGLAIFTGGGTSVPTLSFDVVSTPEPSIGIAALAGAAMLLRRIKRRGPH